MVKVAVLKLILQRFVREFGRSVFSWLVVPILVLITLNLFMLMVVYMECWSITAVDGTRSFTAPFAADAILYLKRRKCRKLSHSVYCLVIQYRECGRSFAVQRNETDMKP